MAETSSYLHWHGTESGYGYCPVGHARAPIRTALALNAPSCSEQLAAVYLLGVNELQNDADSGLLVQVFRLDRL